MWGQLWKKAKPCKRGWAQKALVSFWQNWWDSMNLFKMLMHIKWWFECEITFFTFQFSLHHCGGFQLEFVSISQVINHMTCYKFKCSHWWKIYRNKKNPLQDFLSSLNAVISTNESTWIITGHVIYNPTYSYNSNWEPPSTCSFTFCLSLTKS